MTGQDWNPGLTYAERSEHAGERIAGARKLQNLTREGLAGLANASR